jgi:hypothetical protein
MEPGFQLNLIKFNGRIDRIESNRTSFPFSLLVFQTDDAETKEIENLNFYEAHLKHKNIVAHHGRP